MPEVPSQSPSSSSGSPSRQRRYINILSKSRISGRASSSSTPPTPGSTEQTSEVRRRQSQPDVARQAREQAQSSSVLPSTVKNGFLSPVQPGNAVRSRSMPHLLPVEDLEEEEAASSGMDDGLPWALVHKRDQESRKVSTTTVQAAGGDSGSAGSTPSPNRHLLPPFRRTNSDDHDTLSYHDASTSSFVAATGLGLPADETLPYSSPQCRLPLADYVPSRPRSPATNLFTPASHTSSATPSHSSAVRDFRRALRRFDSAVQLLQQSQQSGGLPRITSPNSRAQSSTMMPINSDPSPAGSPRSPPTDLPAPRPTPASTISPASTPRRSRLTRAFSSSPGQRGSPNPRNTSPRTPSSPPSTRMWQQTLHAILSPSPTLGRSFSPRQPTDRDELVSSPMVAQVELTQWEICNAVDIVRTAQLELLHSIKEVAELHAGIPVTSRDCKESVMFFAQAVVSGLEFPSSAATAASLAALRTGASHLVQAYSAILERTFCDARCSGLEPAATISMASVLLQCLGAKLPADLESEDVFGSSTLRTGTYDDEKLQANVKTFLDAYRSCSAVIREYHSAARVERRQRRLDRRLARLARASALYDLPQASAIPSGPDITPAQPADIALLSSQELFQYSLTRAVQDGLFTPDEVESYEPRVLLTLPRLAVLFGIYESNFPTLAALPASTHPQRGTVLDAPMEVFLPRLCRTLPHEIIRYIRKLSPTEMKQLANRLCISESTPADSPSNKSDVASSLDDLFRTLAKEADGSGPGNKGGRHLKLMKKVLRTHIAGVEGEQEPDDEDEVTIARAFLTAAGLV